MREPIFLLRWRYEFGPIYRNGGAAKLAEHAGELARRWWCRRFGHRPGTSTPNGVIVFPICSRCGKWARDRKPSTPST